MLVMVAQVSPHQSQVRQYQGLAVAVVYIYVTAVLVVLGQMVVVLVVYLIVVLVCRPAELTEQLIQVVVAVLMATQKQV